MNGLISVIVPVYNVAAYLPQCVQSILTQDYPDLEVILIDDGSTDDSGTICDEYAQKDSRVRVIHQKNGGAAAAKNAGLHVASGTYLSFVDSDDFLEPGAYSHMVSRLEAEQTDVIQCAYRDVYRDKTVERLHKEKLDGITAEEYLPRFTREWNCGLLWDKLYRRPLFEETFFEEGHRIDDEYFTYQGIMNARKILRDNRIVYNYRKRRSSVMYSPQSGRQIVLDRVDFLSKRRMKVGSRYPKLKKVFDMHFLEAMMILATDANGSPESIAIIQKQLRSYFREKGHTVPDIRLWPRLMKLCFDDPEKLLSKRSPVKTGTDLNTYFE